MLNVLTVSQSQILLPQSVRKTERKTHLRSSSKPQKGDLMIIIMILAMSGDVEVNPGPVACPCTVCSNSVRKNQRAILCSKCDKWTHAKCCGVSHSEYQILSMSDCVDDQWLCAGCLMAELPLLGDESDLNISSLELTDTLLDSGKSPLEESTATPLFCHLNIQSLLPKIDEVKMLLENAKRPVILGLSETWLNCTVLDHEISIPTYHVYRKDRDWRGGGVRIYVPDRCQSRRRLDLEEDGLEMIWLELHMNRRTILLGNIYRPSHADVNASKDLGCNLERAAAEKKEVVLVGDLNCNILASSHQLNELLSVTEKYNLFQLITEPTRVTDHLLTYYSLQIQRCSLPQVHVL